ncbi:MAG: C4-type zinc ribbon domain-containing protein [Deltaproteobacteria bacterium]
MSLREKLKALEELQQVDIEQTSVRAEAEAVPRRRAEIEVGVGVARKACQAEEDKLASVERERRSQEQTIATERDKVKKWEGRLAEIRTPREYAALSREIDIAKKTNESVGEQTKLLLAQAAEITLAIDVLQEKLDEREAGAQEELEGLTRRASEFAARIVALEARRAALAQKVEPVLLKRYENIRQRRGGIAVTQVVGGTCKGCNRQIPPQMAITLVRANSIENCPNCNRIIYVPEAVSPATPPVA